MSLYERLFDDAAIFPPGNAPMGVAVGAHAGHMQAPYAATVGPFVCSAARLPELIAELGQRDTSIALALVTPLSDFDASVALATGEPRLELQSIEIGMEVAGAVTAVPPGVAVWCEYPWGSDFELPAGAGLKLRTGGEDAGAFPTEQELAAAIMMCAANGVPFKLTAGLHHAIRSTSDQTTSDQTDDQIDGATSFEQHGFLNVILATRAALAGRGADSVVAHLGDRDSAHIADRIGRFTDKDVWAVRHAFHSFGTCSIDDPINDLRDLGLLDLGLLDSGLLEE